MNNKMQETRFAADLPFNESYHELLMVSFNIHSIILEFNIGSEGITLL